VRGRWNQVSAAPLCISAAVHAVPFLSTFESNGEPSAWPLASRTPAPGMMTLNETVSTPLQGRGAWEGRMQRRAARAMTAASRMDSSFAPRPPRARMKWKRCGTCAPEAQAAGQRMETNTAPTPAGRRRAAPQTRRTLTRTEIISKANSSTNTGAPARAGLRNAAGWQHRRGSIARRGGVAQVLRGAAAVSPLAVNASLRRSSGSSISHGRRTEPPASY